MVLLDLGFVCTLGYLNIGIFCYDGKADYYIKKSYKDTKHHLTRAIEFSLNMFRDIYCRFLVEPFRFSVGMTFIGRMIGLKSRY